MPSCETDACASQADGPSYAVIGANHKDTPLDLRECLSILPDDLPEMLKRLRAVDGIDEVVALSTCNRIEIYVVPTGAEPQILDGAAAVMCEASGVDPKDIEPSLYRYQGLSAARHLFTVACGLDSMVPGENEVFSQIKGAYLSAVDAGSAGSGLSRLFQRAFNVAKEVRSRTGISQRKVSIATVVADLAQKVYGHLGHTKVAVVGAGQMAEQTLKALASEKARVSVVANRTIETAEQLASLYEAKAVGLDEVKRSVLEADIVVTSIAVAESILCGEDMKAAVHLRRGRPMLLVDLGVPRNIDATAAELDGVILYDIDDLQEVVSTNVAYRLEQADRAKAIIDEEVRSFAAVLRTDGVSDVIAQLCAELKRIGNEECQRTLGRLEGLSEEQQSEVNLLAHRIVNKILHRPINALKEGARSGTGAQAEQSARKLFGL